MKWLNQPGLRESIKDKTGVTWFFRYWSDLTGNGYERRIFFWDEHLKNTGIMEFIGNKAIHWSRIKDRVIKLINDESYRGKFICPLKFPIEKNY
jgi:hypothetical protein